MQFIIKTYSGCFQKIEMSEYLISPFQYMYSTIEDRAAPLKFMTLIVLMQSNQAFVFCYPKSERAEAGSTKFVVKCSGFGRKATVRLFFACIKFISGNTVHPNTWI